MLIRCDHCQALFSLQDGVVRGAPGPAFAVQCGRCLSVFDAAVPQAGKPAPHGTPAQGSLKIATPGNGVPKTAQRPAQAQPAAGAALRDPGRPDNLATALKPKRPGDAPEEDLFAQELAQRARTRRWLLFGLGGVAVAGVLVVGGFLLKARFTALPAAARAKLEKGRQKLLLDDAVSLAEAAQLFTEAGRLANGEAGPEAERAYALLLLAGSHKDLADRLEAQARELNDQAAKLQLEKPEGWEAKFQGLAGEVKKIDQERDPHVRDATRLLAQGLAAAKAALDEDPDEASAQRAMALYNALSDAADRGRRFLDAAERLAPGNVDNAYVRARLALAGSPSKDKQEQALSALAVVKTGEPRLLRAVYDTGAIELDRQLYGPARQTLTGLLEKNPQHERAKVLLELLPKVQ